MTDPTFAAIPARALADERLTGGHLKALAVIALHDRFGRNGNGCTAGRKRLAEMVRTSETRFSAYTADLRAWGYLRQSRDADDARRRAYRVVYTEADRMVMQADRYQGRYPNEKVSGPIPIGQVIGINPGEIGIKNRQIGIENREIGIKPDLQAVDFIKEPTPNILRERRKEEERPQEADFLTSSSERDRAEARSAGWQTTAEVETYLLACESDTMRALRYLEAPILQTVIDWEGTTPAQRSRALIILCEIQDAYPHLAGGRP